MPKKIEKRTELMENYNYYSPDDLRKIADEMDSRNITSIQIQPDEGVFECRLETEEEEQQRKDKEKKILEDRKEYIIRQAKILGLKVEE